MAKFELKLPKMGESVAEATITSWLKEVGDTIELDEAVLEIATDKVDSEVPSEVDGILIEKFFNVDDVVQVGQTIGIIQTDGDDENTDETLETTSNEASEEKEEEKAAEFVSQSIAAAQEAVAPVVSSEDRFYSPLVKNIAKEEGISQQELDTIVGSGIDNRVTKNDILNYLQNKNGHEAAPVSKVETPVVKSVQPEKQKPAPTPTPTVVSGEDEIIEMTRMGKLIAHHMVESVQTSAHVQSFIEADVTKIWNWRNKVKDAFQKREGENLTFTPIFMEAVAKALRDYPMMNISLQGDTIVKKKNINLGMAASLADGNLIVPVIKNADQLNLVGMTKQVNDLANRARANQLKPDDIQGGTYTVTNVGTFGSIMGTPIINQPQVGILALGAIRKVPAVIETSEGDFIGIRYRMFLSHSYDHRVVNGALGGQFVKAVKDYLEAWDSNREI
ncbi:dihydrolipoamide acetyltransferase family protein [Mariniflexile gromovii]|uniref:Dihydrolipoamide acetyltransferase component of pyruvate dehydrogenase complex n=1 Tax=Mariniflexile gromovii TaxID=362523 RepID=A0ABS4BX30_9FLAO|nr:dihydrolipoamide acetyltransferase family protein [Mariniflexile gromovii]MBP0905145.1 2-oxo acid dehydrogenase subunit E2 [Mariniflexile gromovii]